MKIETWNCHFGFDMKKVEYISKHDADLLLIQECTEDDLSKLNNFWENSLWYGDYIDGKYGIGLFSNRYEITKIEKHKREYRYFVPYEIKTEDDNFILFSVWTKNCDLDKKKKEYTEQTYPALNDSDYFDLLNGSVILMGDFNSNNYFEKDYNRKKVPSHKDIINLLKRFNIKSCYHVFNNCDDGKEKDPTLLWLNNSEQKFHIDYCFASSDFVIKNVTVGSLEEWEKAKLSDHCPMIVELEREGD